MSDMDVVHRYLSLIRAVHLVEHKGPSEQLIDELRALYAGDAPLAIKELLMAWHGFVKSFTGEYLCAYLELIEKEVVRDLN